MSECEKSFLRRSGPGGQNRNKVETAVILRHRPSGVIAEANERRTQAENGRAALFRLRINLALEIRRAVVPQGPSPRWQARCQGGRIAINPAHDDFPALLAEALDLLASRDWDTKAAADSLNCSPTQLLKLLKDEPKAFALLNAERFRRGLRALQ